MIQCPAFIHLGINNEGVMDSGRADDLRTMNKSKSRLSGSINESEAM